MSITGQRRNIRPRNSKPPASSDGRTAHPRPKPSPPSRDRRGSPQGRVGVVFAVVPAQRISVILEVSVRSSMSQVTGPSPVREGAGVGRVQGHGPTATGDLWAVALGPRPVSFPTVCHRRAVIPTRLRRWGACRDWRSSSDERDACELSLPSDYSSSSPWFCVGAMADHGMVLRWTMPTGPPGRRLFVIC